MNVRSVARIVAVLVLGIGVAGGALSQRNSEVLVKKAIADTMTPEELAAYKQRLAERVAARRMAGSPLHSAVRAPADTCTAATPEIGALPYNPAADTTLGMVDDFDLPSDVTAPTCTVGATCTGAGPAGSLPAGAIYNLTGTGPDRAYRIITDANCALAITIDPTGADDLGLIVYQANCSSSLADCACVDDTGANGVAETVTLSAVAGTTYFVVVDGYGGSAGPFTLNITGTGCSLVPVELMDVKVDG